jgi:hypothetical protein
MNFNTNTTFSQYILDSNQGFMSPNPVDKQTSFIYRIVKELSKDAQLKIYDLNGIELYKTSLVTKNDSKNADLGSLKPGQYLVVITNNGVVEVKTYLIKK